MRALDKAQQLDAGGATSARALFQVEPGYLAKFLTRARIESTIRSLTATVSALTPGWSFEVEEFPVIGGIMHVVIRIDRVTGKPAAASPLRPVASRAIERVAGLQERAQASLEDLALRARRI